MLGTQQLVGSSTGAMQGAGGNQGAGGLTLGTGDTNQGAGGGQGAGAGGGGLEGGQEEDWKFAQNRVFSEHDYILAHMKGEQEEQGEQEVEQEEQDEEQEEADRWYNLSQLAEVSSSTAGPIDESSLQVRCH